MDKELQRIKPELAEEKRGQKEADYIIEEERRDWEEEIEEANRIIEEER